VFEILACLGGMADLIMPIILVEEVMVSSKNEMTTFF